MYVNAKRKSAIAAGLARSDTRLDFGNVSTRMIGSIFVYFYT